MVGCDSKCYYLAIDNGWESIKHGPERTYQVWCQPEVWKILQNVGSHTYLEGLQGFDEGVIDEFVENLEGNNSRVCGLEI